MPEFSGIKICQDANVCGSLRDLCHIEVPDGDSERIIIDIPGVLAGGGNSGFQALNLAIQFGATRIILVGFDMHATAGVHWHGPHGKDLNNPTDVNFTKWRRILNAAAGFIRMLGIEVVNASPESALSAYPKMTIQDAMARWGL